MEKQKLQRPKNNKKSWLKKVLEYDISIGKYKELLFENLVMMISSGINIVTALQEFKRESQIKALNEILDDMIYSITNGQAFWLTLKEHKILSGNLLDIVRIGEESGNLSKNLLIVLEQKRKDKEIRQKLITASLYPAIVLIVMIIVGVAVAVFVLPNLTSVYKSFNTDLPALTLLIIGFGDYMQADGRLVLPLGALLLIIFLYFFFIDQRTNVFGQKILLRTPILGKAIKDLEMARFGYLMHSLLNSGFKVVDTLDIIASSSSIREYKRYNEYLAASISNGESFSQSFVANRESNRLIPLYARQSIISGERTGKLNSAFKQIGDTYQKEYDHTTANLYVMLEPILLIMVWIGVFILALAVILPIYNLMGSFSDVTDTSTSVEDTVNNDVKVQTIGKIELISDGKQTIPILANKGGAELYRVVEGEIYEFINYDGEGYEIILRNGNIGWVAQLYAMEVERINNDDLIE